MNDQEFKENYLNTENIVRSDSSFTPYTASSATYSSKKKDLFIPYEEPVREAPVKTDEFAVCITEESNKAAAAEETVIPHNVTEYDSNVLYDIKVVGEIFSTYILCQTETSLVIIDKHAAHERLLYEKLKKMQNNDNQMLLAPVGVNLSAKEKEAVLDNLRVLEQSGFVIEDMGLGGVMVRAVPMNISCDDPQSLVEEIAHNLSEGDGSTMTEKQEWIYHSVACRSAIKACDKATEYELKHLVNDILTEKIPLYCPHGRPVIISLTQRRLKDNLEERKKIIVICGPTASGKTALSISIAKKYNAEIVSADSMQVYKGMDIATANNTVAIVMANPIAKEMADEYGISPRKTASLLDTFSCIFQGVIPYGAQMLVAISAVHELGYSISAFDIMPNLFYPAILLISSLIFIFILPSKNEK